MYNKDLLFDDVALTYDQYKNMLPLTTTIRGFCNCPVTEAI